MVDSVSSFGETGRGEEFWLCIPSGLCIAGGSVFVLQCAYARRMLTLERISSTW